MSKKLAKIEFILKNKIKHIFRFVKFLFLPKNKIFKVGLIIIVLFSIVGFSTFVLAEDPPAPAPAPATVAAPATGAETPKGDKSAEPAAKATTPGDTARSQIAGFINDILFSVVQALGWVVLKMFGLVIIISSYNDFIDSPAVTKGWVLVRDMCNLVFVLIMLVIAFSTILQLDNFGAKKLLAKVLIAAVLVNFSKLICALIIDFGQVVMMTFVNGYAATAGANLVNGLGLDKMVSMSNVPESKGGDGTTQIDVFIALMVAIFMLLMTVVVVFFILLILLVRIVQLWILIVLSPLAFVVKALPFGKIKNEYIGNWWSTFGWSVAVGPFLAFFLWLSLLIMSTSQEDMKKIADYGKLQEKSAGSVVSGVTSFDRLAQTAIGLAMLLASVKIASEAGGAVGGMAKTADKYSTKAAKSLALGMTGAGFVKDRTMAMYDGFKSKRKEAKDMSLAKYNKFGARASSELMAGTGNIKKGVAAGVSGGYNAAKGGVTGLATGIRQGVKESDKGFFKKTLGGITLGLANAQAGMATGAIKGVSNSWKYSSVGSTERIIAQSTRDSDKKARQEEAAKVLKANGIDKDKMSGEDYAKEMHNLMNTTGANKNMRKIAAKELADSGGFENRAEVAKAMALVSGKKIGKSLVISEEDKQTKDAMEKSLKAKQAHLAYDLSSSDGKKALSEDLRSGDVKLNTQNSEAFSDVAFMDTARQALDEKDFAKALTRARDESVEKKTAIDAGLESRKDSAHDEAKKEAEEISVINKEISSAQAVPLPANATPAQKQTHDEAQTRLADAQKRKDAAVARLAELNKKNQENGRDVANVTGDIGLAFKSINFDDSSNTVSEQLDEVALKEYVSPLSGGNLAKKKIDTDDTALIRVLAEKMNTKKLLQMANSGEDGSLARVQAIAEAMVDGANDKKVLQMAGNQGLMEVLEDSPVFEKIKAREEDVRKQAEKEIAKAKQLAQQAQAQTAQASSQPAQTTPASNPTTSSGGTQPQATPKSPAPDTAKVKQIKLNIDIAKRASTPAQITKDLVAVALDEANDNGDSTAVQMIARDNGLMKKLRSSTDAEMKDLHKQIVKINKQLNPRKPKKGSPNS